MPSYGTVIATGGAGNLPTTNELPVDMHKKTLSALVPLTPLLSISSRLAEDAAHNFRIDWQEMGEMPHTVKVATTEDSVSTTIYLQADGRSLVADTLLYNPRANDIRKVTTQPTTTPNTVTVTTSQGGTTAAVWKANDIVHVMAPASAENDDGTYRAASAQDSNVYNYTQLIRMQYCMTRIMDKQVTHFGGAGSKRQELKQQKYREFRIKWEKNLMFGGRATSGTSPADLRLMGGLNHYLRSGTLYKDFNGLLTESAWDNFLLSYHEENPDTLSVDAYLAPAVLQKINYWGKPKIRISPASKKYGLNINEYVSSGLNVRLVPMPLLNEGVVRGWGWLLDPERVRIKNLDPPMFYPDAKNIGESELIYDTYRVVTSMLLGNENRHAMFIGADL